MKRLYIANDGTVFTDEDRCRRYDELMKEIYGTTNCDDEDYDDSREYHQWYYGF